MANFEQRSDYFEDLCVKNKEILHAPGTQKKFFRMDIEELFAGVREDLPGRDAGPLFVLINSISDLDYKSAPRENVQMMFYVLQQYEDEAYTQQQESRENCEKVVHQILKRMKYDSQSGNGIFKHSFDTIKCRIVPADVHFNSSYAGWSVSFSLPQAFNDCYEPNDWNA